MTDLERLEINVYAASLWLTFTKNEKNLVRFGMFPAEKMCEADKAMAHIRDHGRLMAVALMDCAKADGGMRA